MAKITWLGDAECIWNDVTFPAGVPVDITDPYMLGKARNNPFFRVDADVSFFGPRAGGTPVPAPAYAGVNSKAGITPETWTNTPPDDLPLKRKRGRPPKRVPVQAGE